jgi:hypothetical protein
LRYRPRAAARVKSDGAGEARGRYRNARRE